MKKLLHISHRNTHKAGFTSNRLKISDLVGGQPTMLGRLKPANLNVPRWPKFKIDAKTKAIRPYDEENSESDPNELSI